MSAAEEPPEAGAAAAPADEPPEAGAAAAPADEHTQPVAGDEPGFTDTLTLCFADPAAAVCGVIALERGENDAAGALLFVDGELVASHARSDLHTDLARWQALSTDALSIEVDPTWVVEMRADGADLTVEFLPPADPFFFDAASPPGAISGLARSERVCHVAGSMTVGGRELAIDGRGQRSHQWGPSPWPRLASWRALAAWLDDDRALALWGAQPAGGGERDREALAACVVESGPYRTLGVADPRISTSYGADGRPLRAGLELWLGADDDFAQRAAGELICAGALRLGSSHQLWSFLDWRMEGHAGVGALAVVTPEAAA
jgi:hypothetical protein